MKNGLSVRVTFIVVHGNRMLRNYEAATKFLTGRYATDTSYNKKLNGLIETYDLIEYDKEKATKVSAEGLPFL